MYLSDYLWTLVEILKKLMHVNPMDFEWISLMEFSGAIN
jgi:hypothetical protein